MTDEKLILFYLVFGEILVDIDTWGEGDSTLSFNMSTSSDVLQWEREAVNPSRRRTDTHPDYIIMSPASNALYFCGCQCQAGTNYNISAQLLFVQ